jgi:hypothetical protein
MNQSELIASFFIVFLFLGMLACMELGRRLGNRSTPQEGGKEGLGVIEGAIFALLGLLVAFTFSGAATGNRQLTTGNWLLKFSRPADFLWRSYHPPRYTIR